MLESIDRLLAENENSLAVPMTRVNQAVAEVVDINAKAVKRLAEKILRAADRESVSIDNHLDRVYTGLLGGVDTWLQESQFLLQQLSVKGGLSEIGSPLETALEIAATQSPGLEYMGTLVLAVKEAVPWLDRIAVALEKIAAGAGGGLDVAPDRQLMDDIAAELSEMTGDDDEEIFDAPLV